MKLNYRFKHSKTWETMEVGGGMIKTDDFARWVCSRHRMDRVIIEAQGTYIRSNTWVIVRRVPRYYRVVPPPPKPVLAPVETKPCYDIESEFGRDPMSERPDTRVWRPTNRPFFSIEAFDLEHRLF